MSEKLCLQWNEFRENACGAFASLRENADFADVTLASEDGQQVDAHRVILAAASPFFQNLLKRNKRSHIVVCLRGVKSAYMNAIIDFIYLGEAKIDQENLESFLVIADELKLKGLTGLKKDFQDQGQSGLKRTKDEPHDDNLEHQREVYVNHSRQGLNGSDYNEDSTAGQQVEKPLKNISHGDLRELGTRYFAVMEKTGNKNIHGQPIYQCKLCGKTGKNSQLKQHIRYKHGENLGYQAPLAHC